MMTSRQGWIAALLGISLWACGATIVHFFPVLFDGGIATAVMFGVGVLTSLVTVEAARRLGSASGGPLVAMMALGTGIALLLDGIGLAFVSDIYAGRSFASQAGAAFIMWAGGAGLLIALVTERKR
ncbi:hypothetical protein J2Y54_001479 [Sphingomonas sp. BE123]|jgi:hypothetical protein|uniref:hypothetical protein n=1 Tax=Sphingomonas sp. BE123 TaxID=2817842 RepID=UPI002864FE39|nr:hypothetical protein [Sphingomonas sp. BE123]MDR6851986.1 hypothetical protein [Sphingomonas sp. BE123]